MRKKPNKIEEAYRLVERAIDEAEDGLRDKKDNLEFLEMVESWVAGKIECIRDELEDEG